MSEKLTITDSDEFDNITVTGSRDTSEESLVISTASSVTRPTSSEKVNNTIAGVDLSAGTMEIQLSMSVPITKVNGEGKNTIKGGAGAESSLWWQDVISGCFTCTTSTL